MTLPCVTPGCNGLMIFSGQFWGCPTCHHAYSNDEVKQTLLPTDAEAEAQQAAEEEARWDPWTDEQRLKRQLIPAGSHASKSIKRKRGKKRGDFVPWYQAPSGRG